MANVLLGTDGLMETDARLVMLLTQELTEKLLEVCAFTGDAPYTTIANAINTLHRASLEALKNG